MMPLYDPPKEFVTRLKDFDAALRIRWSDAEDRWRIERKISRGKWINPSTFHASRYEDIISARDGYIPVLYCQQNELDERVFLSLWHMDIWRRGGSRRVADQMEARENGQRQSTRAQWLDDVWMAAKACKNYMNTVRTLDERHAHTAPRGGMSIVAGNEVS
jgi:hypothetical protein